MLDVDSALTVFLLQDNLNLSMKLPWFGFWRWVFFFSTVPIFSQGSFANQTFPITTAISFCSSTINILIF